MFVYVQERAKAKKHIHIINGLLQKVRAGWQMKEYVAEWRKPSLTGAAVSKVINGHRKWLQLNLQEESSFDRGGRR